MPDTPASSTTQAPARTVILRMGILRLLNDSQQGREVIHPDALRWHLLPGCLCLRGENDRFPVSREWLWPRGCRCCLLSATIPARRSPERIPRTPRRRGPRCVGAWVASRRERARATASADPFRTPPTRRA